MGGRVVHGRDSEIESIEELLSDARRGRGGCLVLEGPAGIGKTTLVEVARERAKSFRVIESVGVESETDLAFAAITEICRSLHEAMDRIPAAQAVALDAAMGRSEMMLAESDPLVIFNGFSALINEASSEQPLLILLDDAHWYDVSSRACLAYAVRRIGDTRCAVLAVTRNGPAAAPLDGWEAPWLKIDGLDHAAAEAVLRDQAPDLSREAVRAIEEAAEGNPLALMSLPELLTPGQREATEPIGSLPTGSDALREVVSLRLEGLSDETMEALLLLALSPARGTNSALGAMGTIDLEGTVLEAAEHRGLIRFSSVGIEFAHPVLRAEIARRVSPGDRRRAHVLLAHHSHPQARAWHLAASAIGPDDDAANELEAAARSATSRGAHASAAEAMARAAELTAADSTRCTRLYMAGLSAALSGDYEWASNLLEDSASGRMRPFGQHLLAMVRVTGGTLPAREILRLLLAEAELTRYDQPQQAAQMFADAALIAVFGGFCIEAVEAAREAEGLIEDETFDDLRCQIESALGMTLALSGQTTAAREALDAAGGRLDQIPTQSPAAQSVCFALGGRLCTGQEALLLDEVRSFIARADREGVIGLVPYFHIQASDAAYRLGKWPAAMADAERAVDKAQATGQVAPLSMALVVKARIHAARGEAVEAEACANRAIELTEPIGYGLPLICGRAALGFLYLGLGETGRAIVELERLGPPTEAAGLFGPIIVPWIPDLVEALVESGQKAEAAPFVAMLREAAELNGTPLARGYASRCEALVNGTPTGYLFEGAIRLHSKAAVPLELGRSLLLAGSAYRREGLRPQANDRLGAARRVFDGLGSVPWADRTQREIWALDDIRNPSEIEGSKGDLHPDQDNRPGHE